MNALLCNTIIVIFVISFIFLIKSFFYPTQPIEKNHIKIVLSGPPKSGKTTVLKKLLKKIANSNQNIYGCIVQEVLDEHQKRIGFKNIFLPASRDIILASKKNNIFKHFCRLK